MKRVILILAVVFLMVLRPGLSWAETRVYVSFSVGGAVAIGAGFLFWGISYSSRVSERISPEENPNRRSLITGASASNSQPSIQLLPIQMSQPITKDERTPADFLPAPQDPRTALSIEAPLLVLRW